MQRAAARQALGARWFVAAGAVFIFLMALAPLAEGTVRAAYIVALCALWFAATVGATGGILVRSRPVVGAALLASLTMIVAVALVVSGGWLYLRFDFVWGPPLAGVTAVVAYLVGFRGVHAVTRAAFARRTRRSGP